jgi:hypothetical protein
MNLPVEIRFTPTKREIIQVTRRELLRHPSTYWVPLFFAGCAGATLYAHSLGTSPFGSGSQFVAGLLAIGGVFFYLNRILLVPSKVYEAYNSETREMERYYRFTGTGVEYKGESFQGRGDWSNFGHFTETRDYFVIYPKAEGNLWIIPKRAFPSAESVDALRELFRTKLRVW